MTEQTVIKTYFHANGAPAARIVATRTDEDFGEKAGTYCHTTAHTRVTREPYLAHLHRPYYEDTQVPQTDGPIARAWERYSDEYDTDDALEMLERYARIFHPMTPVITATLQTGYSQGDWVEIVSWMEEHNQDRQPGEPAYEAAARAAQQIRDHHDIMEAVSRGQFWTVELQTPSFTFETTDDEDAYTVTADWQEDDEGPYLTLAMEEFSPWAELIEYAEESFNTPAHHTSTTDTYEI